MSSWAWATMNPGTVGLTAAANSSAETCLGWAFMCEHSEENRANLGQNGVHARPLDGDGVGLGLVLGLSHGRAEKGD